MPPTQPIRQPLHHLLGSRYLTSTKPQPLLQAFPQLANTPTSTASNSAASTTQIATATAQTGPVTSSMTMQSLRTIATAVPAKQVFPAVAAGGGTRHYLHTSTRLWQSKKDDNMDRTALNPTSTEYSKTGGGDQAAAEEGTAFDPKKTSPESQLGDAEAGEGGDNPLEVSPGNNQTGKSADSARKESGDGSRKASGGSAGGTRAKSSTASG